jgi:hypothetical protein
MQLLLLLYFYKKNSDGLEIEKKHNLIKLKIRNSSQILAEENPSPHF